ncbi:hypothetical protein PMAYCL1PPCAC_01290 [Pristionchus mayeri]|uniref:Uncharacterized protein n=1 Tax=Pristionchus mayeri TaxID=1317129 RepID=A0AAN4Z5K7_9BILA|nr:hypothetical protein PMAYCL1PPCAC_01290 [Pristionchus mayeri]
MRLVTERIRSLCWISCNAITALFILSPILIAILAAPRVSFRYSCLLPLARLLLYFYAVISVTSCLMLLFLSDEIVDSKHNYTFKIYLKVIKIFRLGVLSGTSGASFGECPMVCLFTVICILLSGCLISGVAYVVEELEEMRRMSYWTDTSI